MQDLEADLDGSQADILPDIMVKLLYALTYSRQIKCVCDIPPAYLSRDNVFEHIRRQYHKRTGTPGALGTAEDPVDWSEIGISQKVFNWPQGEG
jgi:hypothetical protein